MLLYHIHTMRSNLPMIVALPMIIIMIYAAVIVIMYLINSRSENFYVIHRPVHQQNVVTRRPAYVPRSSISSMLYGAGGKNWIR